LGRGEEPEGVVMCINDGSYGVESITEVICVEWMLCVCVCGGEKVSMWGKGEGEETTM